MRAKLGAVAGATVLVVLTPSAAQAALVAAWKMDEGPGAATMVDSVGGDNNGQVNSVITGVKGLAGGNAYQFDGATSWVEVPDKDNLDPGSANITLKATVRVEGDVIQDDSYEIVRKGLVTTKGGDWKMEIKRSGSNNTVGKLHCVFKGVLPSGATSLVSKQAAVDVVDGRPHTLECRKTATSVTALVDGRAASVTKPAGSIANNQPVMVGSKVAGDDVLQGILDQVTVDIG